MAIYCALSELEEGESISYEKLSEIAHGEDVQREKRHLLQTAIKWSLSDDIVIGCVRDVGVYRLKNNEIDSIADQAHRQIRRRAKRTARALSACDYDRLNEDERREHTARLAFVGALQLFTKPSTIKKIAANTNPGEVDNSKTLALFQ